MAEDTTDDATAKSTDETTEETASPETPETPETPAEPTAEEEAAKAEAAAAAAAPAPEPEPVPAEPSDSLARAKAILGGMPAKSNLNQQTAVGSVAAACALVDIAESLRDLVQQDGVAE